MRVSNHNTLARTCDQPAFLPCTKQPADRVQCGACHIRKVLTGDRKVDGDAVFNLLAVLVDQSQKGVCDPLFNVLGRHFDHAIVNLAHTLAQRLVVFCGKPRIVCRKFMPERVWPGQCQAFVCGHGSGRISIPVHRGGNAKQLARCNMQNNNLVAVWRGADNPDVAIQQQIEPACRVAFDKDRQFSIKTFRCRQIQNGPYLSFCKVAKGREVR